MLSNLLELKLATTMMAGWLSASSPAPVPEQAIALLVDAHAAMPVEVKFFDFNERTSASLLIERDGSADPETTQRLTQLFRCRKTGHRRPMARRTLAILVDVAERYPGKSIEFVSAHRATRDESATSPHRAARALDFRIRGVEPREIRDYLWRKYTDVGVGWYPSDKYIHIDSRPGQGDTAWTFQDHKNKYKPYWAELARAKELPKTLAPSRERPGS